MTYSLHDYMYIYIYNASTHVYIHIGTQACFTHSIRPQRKAMNRKASGGQYVSVGHGVGGQVHGGGGIGGSRLGGIPMGFKSWGTPLESHGQLSVAPFNYIKVI